MISGWIKEILSCVVLFVDEVNNIFNIVKMKTSHKKLTHCKLSKTYFEPFTYLYGIETRICKRRGTLSMMIGWLYFYEK